MTTIPTTSHASGATPIRLGLIGCGSNGQIHADGLAKLAEDGLIVPVKAADPDRAGCEAADRNCHFEELTTDPTDILDDPDIDAVMICTPTRFHKDAVLSAVKAGKAVMCEKPLCPNQPDVEELCAEVLASPDANSRARVGFNTRFHPLYRNLAAHVKKETWGAPMTYAVRDDQFFPTGEVVPGHSTWRGDPEIAGGGALLEHSIHAVDILVWTFGPVARVHARTRHVFGKGIEDTAVLMIEHESGVTGTLVSVFNGVIGREERRFEVFFEQASVELTSDFIIGAPEDSFLVQLPNEQASYPDMIELREALFAELGVSRRDLLFHQYLADRAWLLAVGGHESEGPGFADALAAHRVVEAAYRSARTGAPVDIPAGGFPRITP